MLKINFRIVDDFDELRSIKHTIFDSDYNHISGFIEILFGEHNEGCYYHEDPLQEGETGGELLDWWLNFIMDVVNSLEEKSYVAFLEPETKNRWLEFRLDTDHVMINVAIDEEEKNSNNVFITEPFSGFSYVQPVDFSVPFYQFSNEIASTVKHFITELGNINPELLKTKMALEFIAKLKD